MAKNTVTLLCFCAGVASYSMPSPSLAIRQANGAVDASSFLRRAFQSSAVLDGRIYIDGGDYSYTNSDNKTVYQYSDTLLSIDLTKHWTNDSVVLDSSPKPDGVPSLNSGGIWTDLRNNLMYTGFAGINSFFGNGNTSPQGLWSFSPDGDGGGAWKNLNATADGVFVSRPRPFSGSVASGEGSGYLYGGMFGNSSDFQNSPRGMFAYDFSSKQATFGRDSGASASSTGTQDGGMVFVPYFGNIGIIISAGGRERQGNGGNGGNNGNGAPNGGGGPGEGGGQNGGGSLASFSTVQVYNPQDQKWYDQKTSGTAPSGRMQFCMAGMPSNNRTYEILVYAGWSGNPGSGSVRFDDAYVLTLPGFHWVKADYAAANPRYGLSCNAVGGGQVITIAGVDPTQGQEQQRQQRQQNGGSRNRQNNQNNPNDGYYLGFNTPDPFTQGLGVFDLGSLSWKSSYSPRPFLYTPNSQVQDYYNVNGRQPSDGFDSSSLQSLFAQNDFNNGDDLPFPGGGGPGGYGSNNTNAGAIIGGVVGGLAAISAGLAFFVWRKRRYQAKKSPQSTNSDSDSDELQDQTGMNNLAAAAREEDANARIEHANSSSRYPYSPTGFYYNQPQLPEIATSMGPVPVPVAAVAVGTSAAAEVEAEVYALASVAGEKAHAMPPPAYEERESTPTGGSGVAGGGGQVEETVHELPLSEAGSGTTGELNRASTLMRSGGVGGGGAEGIDTVVDGMRPPQEHQTQAQQSEVSELHGETSGRAELE
ncbi:hypothetical protein V8F20_002020 [Naviculisporaceae sp. PSN 640]